MIKTHFFLKVSTKCNSSQEVRRFVFKKDSPKGLLFALIRLLKTMCVGRLMSTKINILLNFRNETLSKDAVNVNANSGLLEN